MYVNANNIRSDMSNINDLPAFPPANLTKNKAEELLAEIEKAKNPLTTYLKNKAGGEEWQKN